MPNVTTDKTAPINCKSRVALSFTALRRNFTIHLVPVII